ncbi:EpsG family protein [Weissella confusa]|uniref:EpsG family protein n=1 Tax=Weissella confusa TaxID=1583 RepID=A0AAJ3DBA1_WEICO|nr:EpsG family protein [Weissella confusa]NBA11173.1 hypothetical protein [Weissella confusa]
MIWILLLVQNVLATFFGRFERLSGFLTFIGLGFIAGLADPRHNADYSLYKNSYDLGWQNFEHGYTWIATRSMQYGISYSTFRFWLLLSIFVLLAFSLSLITRRLAAVAFFYGVSAFALDSIQVRNVAATAFIVLAIAVLVRFPNFKGVVLSFVCLWLGAEFHTIAYIFLVVPIFAIWKFDFSKYFNFFVIVVYTISLLMFSNLKLYFSIFIAKILETVSSRSNLGSNILEVYSQGTVFRYWVMLATVALMLFWLFSYGFRTVSISEDEYEYNSSVSVVILIGVVSVFLMTISVDYVRVLRIVSLFFFVFVMDLFDKFLQEKHVGQAWLIYLYTFVYSILFLYVQLRYVYVVQDSFGYIVGLIDPNILR